MKYVVFYETAPDRMAAARENFPAHKALLDTFHADGRLLLVGPWENPAEGAMAIFSTSVAAAEFVSADPFVLNGVINRWTIRAWNEIYGG